mmetsp:Transcript_35551/g.36231  ORF Transcript_35551/g.36231 Transcript_35551/m.36231 type:complete len:82 (+) Transcript_35551:276-521(+)
MNLVVARIVDVRKKMLGSGDQEVEEEEGVVEIEVKGNMGREERPAEMFVMPFREESVLVVRAVALLTSRRREKKLKLIWFK